MFLGECLNNFAIACKWFGLFPFSGALGELIKIMEGLVGSAYLTL